MERLNHLVTQFYSSGDSSARSLLEQEVEQLRREPRCIALVLDHVIAPALCCSEKQAQDNAIHPQLVFVCLGLVQSFIRQWSRLPSDAQVAIIQSLINCFHGPILVSTSCPTYISSKVVQLLADVALFTWPNTCDPINVAVQSLQSNTMSSTNVIQLRMALNLILTTCQALSSASSCKYLLTARGAEIQSQWPQYASELEGFIHQSLRSLTCDAPSSLSAQSLRSPLSPTSFAAGAGAYPSPISPSNPSSASFNPICLDRPSARICLQILQLFTHQLQPPTLDLLHSLGTSLHPCYGKSIPFSALDTLHAQLVLPRLDQAKFTHVLGAAVQVLTDVMSLHQLSCPVPPAGSDADDAGGTDTDGDDVMHDADDANDNDPGGRQDMCPLVGALARKALRDLGAPIAAQHLLRVTPSQMVQLANALLAALHLPGPPGREARKAVLEVLHAAAAMANKAEYVPLVQQVVQVVARGLDGVGMRDLEEQDNAVAGAPGLEAFLSDGHADIDTHPGLARSRLGQLLALLEGAADIDPMGTLEKVFPTLNTCVDYVDRWVRDGATPNSQGSAGTGHVLNDQVVQAFAVSLRAVSHLAPKCDAVPELAGVPTMVVSKCAELMTQLAPHASTSAPGPSRAMLECVLAVQAMLESVRIHERTSTSPSPASSSPSTPSPSPVPPATESTQIVQQLVTAVLAVLSTGGPVLQFPLAVACARLLASICTTVRPASMPAIHPHVVQCAQSIVSSVPDLGLPIVDPAMRAVVACCVYPTDGNQLSVRAGSDEAKVRGRQLRDALGTLAMAAGGTSAAMLPLLTSVVAAVSTDAHTTKAMVAAVLDELRWTSPLVSELSQLLAATAEGNGPSASAAERINDLTRFFSLYVATFVRSPLAQGLCGALLHSPLLVRGAYPTITPGVHRLLEKLVADGKCFEPHLARFGAVLSASVTARPTVPFPASLLGVTSRVLIDHWRAFFPGGILSSSEELRHADTLHVLVRVPLMALESLDVELVRAGLRALIAVHDRWRLFFKPLWVAEYRAMAIRVVVAALLKDELNLLQDDLVAVLKGMVAFDSVAEDVFSDSLKCVYESFVGALVNTLQAGTNCTGEVAAQWEGQVRQVVGGQVADKAACEAGIKSLVHDFKCVANGF